MSLPLALLALAAGVGLALQPGANAAVARAAGRPEWGAVANFAIGLVGLVTLLAVQGQRPPSLEAMGRAPWWSWVGGLLGAFFVSSALYLAPRLGAATTFALIIAGQVAGALAVDTFGLMGLPGRALTPARLLGALLVAGGVLLFQRG